MKKLVFLILLVLLFCSGCYDYTELNEMAIVSGIAVDYKDDKFDVTFEILNTKNKEDNSDQAKVYYASGKGKTISEAFSDTSLEIAKAPYLAHLKALVINEEIAKEHVEEIIDFLIRDNHIRNIFYMAISKGISASDVITNSDTNNPIVSNAIADLIESPTFTNNISSDLNFEKFVTNIIDPRKDTYISTIEIENEIIKLGPIGIFKGYKLESYLTEEESATFNVMNGSSNEIHFKIKCPNDEDNFILLTTFNKPKSGIEIKDKTVNVTAEVETRIIENHCKMDFKEIKTYEKIQKSLEKKLKNDMQDVVNKSIKYDSDILKIKQIYYQKNKKDIDFKKLNYKYDANVIINRNGLIFEVKK